MRAGGIAINVASGLVGALAAVSGPIDQLMHFDQTAENIVLVLNSQRPKGGAGGVKPIGIAQSHNASAVCRIWIAFELDAARGRRPADGEMLEAVVFNFSAVAVALNDALEARRAV